MATITLDWSDICHILNTKGFFDKQQDANQLKLQQLFEEAQRVDFDHFKTHLCKALEKSNDEDKPYIFYEILHNQMNYTIVKRQQFYLILLFNYLELNDLNEQNITDILTNIIRKYDPNIERHDVERIIHNKSINIHTLQQLVHEQKCDALLSTFSILGLTKNDWRPIHHFLRSHIYPQNNGDTQLMSDIINKSLTASSMDTQIKIYDDLQSTGTHSGRTVYPSLNDCTNVDILMALTNHILPALNLETDRLIYYISTSQLDGNQLQSMGVKSFLDILWTQCGVKKGKGRSIWTALVRFDFDQYKGNKIDVLHDDEWNDNNIQSVEQCNTPQLMYILKHYVLPSLKKKVITRNTDKIMQYFVENNIDGQYMNDVKRTEFCESIASFVDDKKLKGSAPKIYAALTKFDLSAIQQENDQKEDDSVVQEEDSLMIKTYRKCNKDQMICLVEKICARCDSLRDKQQMFISFFVYNNINGETFQSISKEAFTEQILSYTNDDTMRQTAMLFYDALNEYDINEVSDHYNNSLVIFEEDKNEQEIDTMYNNNVSPLIPRNVSLYNKDIIQLSAQEMLDLVDDICTKSRVLMDKKEILRSYFTTNNINGAQVMQMTQKDFIEDIVSFTNDDTLRAPSMELYKALSLATTPTTQTEAEPELFVPYVLSTIDWENVSEMKQCTHQHLLCIIDKICSDAPDDSILKGHRDTFLAYFVEHTMDGNDVLHINRKAFSVSIAEFAKNKKIRGASLKLLTNILAFVPQTMWDITDDDAYDDVVLEDIEEEEEKESSNTDYTMEIIWDDITDIKQCTNEHIVYILKHYMFDRLNDKILNTRKEAIIKYFVQQRIDGKKLLSMNRDREKFNDALITLYKALAEFDLRLIGRPKDEILQAINARSWCGIQGIIELSTHQIVYLLENYMFPELDSDTLTNHKRRIVAYFTQQKVDGVSLLAMGRKEFSSNLCKYCNDRTMTDAAIYLYKSLKRFDVEQVPRDIVMREHLKESEREDLKYDTPQYEDPTFDFAVGARTSLMVFDGEMDGNKRGFKVPQIAYDDDAKERLPLYLHHCLFSTRDDDTYDEKMELLMDEGVKIVSGQTVHWNDAHFVKMLYEDGIKLDHKGTKAMFYDFVKHVYNKAGANAFFDEFIVIHYEREMKLWRDSMKSYKELINKFEILHILNQIDFNELDVTDAMRSDELQKYMKQLGYVVDRDLLHDVLSHMDQMNLMDATLTLNNFASSSNTFRRLESEHFEQKEEKRNEICYVYYHSSQNRYEFSFNELPTDKSSIYQLVATLNNEISDTFAKKWAVFINTLTKTQRYEFGAGIDAVGNETSRAYYWKIEDRYPNLDTDIIPKGYWHIMYDEEDDEVGDITKEDLQLIHQLLDHYYTLNADKILQMEYMHDNTPLRLLYATGSMNDLSKRHVVDKDIRFMINDNEYQFIWWNNKNRYEPNAFALINLTIHKNSAGLLPNNNPKLGHTTRKLRNKQPKAVEIFYMRFQCAPHFQQIHWELYDDKACKYTRFGDEYKPILDILEVSFLSNIKHNFDPSQFRLQFSHCLLPIIREYPRKRHSLRCIFDATHKHWKSVISHVELITFDLETHHAAIHKVRRIIHERNSLELIYRDSNTFCRRWKVIRNLVTEQQQLYFFAYIVCVTTMIKYIDIEFINQPVVIPSYKHKQTVCNDINTMIDDMIGSNDGEEGATNYKTKPLKKAIVHIPQTDTETTMNVNPSKHIEMTEIVKSSARNKEVYLQDVDDYHGQSFSRDEAQFLRLMECVRKYVLEYEAGDTMKCIWSWSNNSFHVNNIQSYHELVKRFDLTHIWSVSEIKTHLNMHDCNVKHDRKPTRLKRKLAARMFLNPHIIARNINLLRNQLEPLLNHILDEITNGHNGDIYDAHMEDSKNNEEEMKREQLITIPEEEGQTDKYAMIVNYCTHHIIGNRSFWPRQIQQINCTFIVNHIQMTDSLDIDEFKLPLFTEFVASLFMISDKKLHYTLMNPNDVIKGSDYKWYRIFMSHWRNTPIWWNYKHDILLLELVLRNGVHHKKIVNDLVGNKHKEYKIRLKCHETNIVNDPYYAFHEWCCDESNILQRLKYVTNIMVKNLEKTKYGGNTPLISVHVPRKTDRPKYNVSSLLFSGYQRSIHCKYVAKDRFNIPEITADITEMKEIRKPKKRCCCCNGIWNNIYCSKCCNNSAVQEEGYSLVPDTVLDDYNPMEQSTTTLLTLHQDMTHMDPFVERNIDIELRDTLHAFNAEFYGTALVKCIVNQIQKENNPAYWKVFDKVLNALSYSSAIAAINDPDTKQILVNVAEPHVLDPILDRVVKASSFPLCAALKIADFFDDASNIDMYHHFLWDRYTTKYQNMASNEINKIENPHLLLILLNMPLSEYNDVTFLSMAVDQKQTHLLQSERFTHLIDYLYTNRFVHPQNNTSNAQYTYCDLLSMLFFYPFRFFFTPQGYHWICGISFIIYMFFIMFYLYFLSTNKTNYNSWEMALDIILWTTNVGYVLYDVTECVEKGIPKYLKHNALNITISFIWVLLLTLRVLFLVDTHWLQPIYICGFGIQILLLFIKGLLLFSTTKYINIFCQIITLMFVHIIKFLVAFTWIIIAILCAFGLFVLAINPCGDNECELFNVYNITDALQYTFSIFIGIQDFSELPDETMSILWIVPAIAAILGSLMLILILIASISTTYCDMEMIAAHDMIYNKVKLTLDLTQKKQLMLPPPLNIVVWIITVIIHIFNLFFALMMPTKCNIYAKIDHLLFFNLQNFNLWQCERDDECQWTYSQSTNVRRYWTRLDVIQFYFVEWFDCSQCYQNNSEWKIHHNICYGDIVLNEGNRCMFRGITMSQYIKRYENCKQRNIQKRDKLLLKRVGINTLFCPFCYNILSNNNNMDSVTTPYIALLNYISAIIFLIVPIIWICLLIMFSILTIKEYVFDVCQFNVNRKRN